MPFYSMKLPSKYPILVTLFIEIGFEIFFLLPILGKFGSSTLMNLTIKLVWRPINFIDFCCATAREMMMTREANRLNFKCFQMVSRFQIGTASVLPASQPPVQVGNCLSLNSLPFTIKYIWAKPRVTHRLDRLFLALLLKQKSHMLGQQEIQSIFLAARKCEICGCLIRCMLFAQNVHSSVEIRKTIFSWTRLFLDCCS